MNRTIWVPFPFLVFFLLSGTTVGEGSSPTVQMQEGEVIGRTVVFSESAFTKITNITSKSIDVFQGIPYAEPPERFKVPVPKKPWQGVWNATSFTSSCSQDPHLYYPPSSEDCLYLNVYVQNPKPSQAAVLVWIHGGSIEIGTSMTWDFYGLPLVAVSDVILVTLNYRLGIFSQFTTRDNEAIGNLAMFDQVLALKWVNNNIAAFGGDPSRITIFGVSSGASSVSLHLLSKLSRGLFSQAIIQSGSSLTNWAFFDDKTTDLRNAFDLGRAMDCDVTNTSTLVSCLTAKPADDLRRRAKQIYSAYTAMHIDGTFLEDTPTAIYEAGDFAHVPVIIGFGKDEGTMIPFLSFPKYTGDPHPPFINKTTFNAFAKSSISLLLLPNGVNIAPLMDAVSHEYTDWSQADNPNADYYQALVDMSGDIIFSCPADAQLRFHTGFGDKTFAYFFTHAPYATSYAQVGDIVPFTPWVNAGHAEELMFVFGMPFIEELADIHGNNMTDEERALSVKIMTMWSNFAKYGDPSKYSSTDSPSQGESRWPMYTIPDLSFKELSLDLDVGRAKRARQCHLLNSYIPQLAQVTGDEDPSVREWKEHFNEWQISMAEWRKQFDDYNSKKTC
nr:cholinesterase-like [Lytechinus pictus]